VKYIAKGSEPSVLRIYKADGNTLYEGGSLNKIEIQRQLLQEQKGLCAYCMSRISINEGMRPRMIIEHIKCRTNYTDLQLDYENMLGVCLGGSDNKFRQAHCDKSKDSSSSHYDIQTLNPLKVNVESFIQFIETGTMLSLNKDISVDKDIEALNLNEEFLRINRGQILRELKDGYKRAWNRSSSDVHHFLNENIKKWSQLNPKGYLPEYNLVALKFLNKKLDRIK